MAGGLTWHLTIPSYVRASHNTVTYTPASDTLALPLAVLLGGQVLGLLVAGEQGLEPIRVAVHVAHFDGFLVGQGHARRGDATPLPFDLLARALLKVPA